MTGVQTCALPISLLSATYRWFVDDSVIWGITEGFYYGAGGGLLVFVLAIGYFITPELVGGKDGKLIGSWIAYHLKTTLNWGLCAALGAILLGVMLVFYWLYNKIVGIDNIKLG